MSTPKKLAIIALAWLAAGLLVALAIGKALDADHRWGAPDHWDDGTGSITTSITNPKAAQ